MEWGLLCVQLENVNSVVGIAVGRFVVRVTQPHVAGLEEPRGPRPLLAT